MCCRNVFAMVLGTLALTFLACPAAFAQAYPGKPIRLIAPFPPGGGLDATARIVATALSEAFGQQVVVDNRGGASGRIGTEIAARAPADGYHLLVGSVAPNAIIPATYTKLPYDALRDFAPISLVAETEYVLVVHPSLPAKSVKEVVSLARTRPAEITFASTGNLGGPHLAGEFFKQLAGVDMVHVAYKGGAAAATSILSGETSLMFASGPTAAAHGKAGRLRLIATTGAAPSRFMSGLPTVAETLPGYEITQWYGILAPAGTPGEIVSKLNAVLVKAMQEPKIARQFEVLGARTRTTTPEQFLAHIKAEMEKWGRVIKTSGIRVD